MTLRRLRWSATAVAGAMVVVTVVVTLIGNHSIKQTAEGMVPAPLAAGDPLYGGKPLPAIPLIDENGRRTSLAAYRGRYVVFAPSMTLCSEVCPMTTGVLMELLARLRKEGLASQVVVAEVTVDPWRDSPKRLRAYKRMTGADFTMLTGSVQNIRRLWKRLGIYFQRVPQGNPPAVDWMTHKPLRFDVTHSDGLFVLDPAGAERIVIGGMPQPEGRLRPALHRLLDAEGRHNLAHPELPWTSSQLLDDLDWLMGRRVPADSLSQTSAPSAKAAAKELAGSPAALASLHAQASKLLGSASALQARLRSLHGYPAVVNVWASWCPACKAEFSLFAAASASYGRKVAFLGYDADDVASKAREFLASHRVSYPSYQGETGAISSLATLTSGLPDTIFVDSQGKVSYVHIGDYETEGTLVSDIERYALRP
jgi:cytochrome oxidase Cu insertion factor (SCO1/SenC/PrrC family)/thiol-disulfide isomerase/thioredoxin